MPKCHIVVAPEPVDFRNVGFAGRWAIASLCGSLVSNPKAIASQEVTELGLPDWPAHKLCRKCKVLAEKESTEKRKWLYAVQDGQEAMLEISEEDLP